MYKKRADLLGQLFFSYLRFNLAENFSARLCAVGEMGAGSACSKIIHRIIFEG